MKTYSHSKLVKLYKIKKKLNKNKKFIYLKIFKFINFFRYIEEALEKNYHPLDEMKCPIHFAHGQESVPAAINVLIKKKDYMFSHHRSHGYYIAKNAPIEKLFAELHGKKTGANSGIAGSQDISCEKNRFFSGAILAGSVSVAVGTAMSLKVNKSKNIVISAFGEAATEQGVFWESLNYSSLHEFPILFICENNNLSVLTTQKERQSGESICNKSRSFGVKSSQILSNDPIKTYDEIKKGLDFVRKNKKPYLIEAFTYRTISHVGPLSDDLSNLKDTKEYKFWKKNNPRDSLADTLLKNNFLSIKNYNIMNALFKKKIENYFIFARKSLFPKIKSFNNLNLSMKNNQFKNKIKILNKSKTAFKLQKEVQFKGY
jgi:pyruvate dehydrogenase E1 component alpha subunit